MIRLINIIWAAIKTLASYTQAFVHTVDWGKVLSPCGEIILKVVIGAWMFQAFLFLIFFTLWRVFSTCARINHYFKETAYHNVIISRRWARLGIPLDKFFTFIIALFQKIFTTTFNCLYNFLKRSFFCYFYMILLTYCCQERVLKIRSWVAPYIFFTNHSIFPKKQNEVDMLTTVEVAMWIKNKKFFSVHTICDRKYKLHYEIILGESDYKLQKGCFDKIDRFFFIWGLVAMTGLPWFFQGKLPFLDSSGIDFPQNRTQYFWDSTEFGRQLRQHYWKQVDYPYKMLDRDMWREKYVPRDFTQEFIDRVTRKHWAWKVWEVSSYEEKTEWGWFWDRAEKIGILIFCFVSLFFFFNACDNADLGDWMPPARDEG